MKFLEKVYPILFALSFPLVLYARNSNEIALPDLIVPLACVIAASIFIQFTLRLLHFDLSKQSIVISACWLLFFFYAPLHELVRLRHRYLLGAVVAAVGGLAWLVSRMSKQHVDAATRVFALMAVILVANPVRVLLVELWHASFAIDSYAGPIRNQLESAATQSESIPPDVYYLILDGYGGQATLRETFGFDNSPFLSSLQKQGFYVATESRSNYPVTLSSIPSSMNMEYLHDIEVQLNRRPDLKGRKERIFNGRVARTFKANGYEFFFVGTTGYLRPIDTELVDQYLQYHKLSQYEATLLASSFIRYWGNPGDRTLSYTADGKPWVPDSIPWGFQQIRRLSQRPGPKFVFAHILSPHSPYYHDESCNPVPAYRQQRWDNFKGEFEEYKPPYLAQLQCVNRHLTALVRDLIAARDRKPIIVLQGDHGPPEIVDASIRKYAPDTDLKLFRYHILNAYYVPEQIKSKLYPSISPVNTFRLIFNGAFQETNNLLPDQILEVKRYW